MPKYRSGIRLAIDYISVSKLRRLGGRHQVESTSNSSKHGYRRLFDVGFLVGYQKMDGAKLTAFIQFDEITRCARGLCMKKATIIFLVQTHK